VVASCGLLACTGESVARIVCGDCSEDGLEGIGAVFRVLVGEGASAGVAPEALDSTMLQGEGAVADYLFGVAVRAGQGVSVDWVHQGRAHGN